jgi:ribosomal protein S18 acetylase RimI-like enzyme
VKKLLRTYLGDHSMTMPDAIELRPAVAADIPFMSGLFASIREEELGLVGWDGEQKGALLAMQYEAQSRAYREGYPDSGYQIVLSGGRPIGRIFVDRGREAFRIVDIALLRAYRNRGIGGALVGGVQGEAARAGVPVRLSVQHANPAQRLYQRLGFLPVSGDAMHGEWEWTGRTP